MILRHVSGPIRVGGLNVDDTGSERLDLTQLNNAKLYMKTSQNLLILIRVIKTSFKPLRS